MDALEKRIRKEINTGNCVMLAVAQNSLQALTQIYRDYLCEAIDCEEEGMRFRIDKDDYDNLKKYAKYTAPELVDFIEKSKPDYEVTSTGGILKITEAEAASHLKVIETGRNLGIPTNKPRIFMSEGQKIYLDSMAKIAKDFGQGQI